MTTFITITRVVTHGSTENEPAHLSYHRELINIDSIARLRENHVLHIAGDETIVGQIEQSDAPWNRISTIWTDESYAQLHGLIGLAATIVGLDINGHPCIESYP